MENRSGQLRLLQCKPSGGCIGDNFEDKSVEIDRSGPVVCAFSENYVVILLPADKLEGSGPTGLFS